MTTLGMGPDEMREIAAILHAVLAATRVGTKRDGQPSLVGFVTDPKVVAAAHARVADLLARHPLYPEIDLA